MKVRIHRGAHEIGGSCVEVEAGGARLVLDLGRPLAAGAADEVPLPAVAGLRGGDSSLCGVVITHPHEDHYGLVRQLSADVPVYLGAAATRILLEAAFFTGGGLTISPAGFLSDRAAFMVGPFRVTPYLVDHSAFDAYALLVEAGGRRLFYTGDLRAHGRKAACFQRLVKHPPAAVDVLLMEGTNVRPAGAGHEAASPTPSEDAVEAACAATFAATSGMALAVYSAQNIDRLVTIYRAALRAGRTLVLDLYGASVAAATEHSSIPHLGPDWDRVLVYVPWAQRKHVKDTGQFERVNGLGRKRLFPEELAARASELVMTFRPSMARELDAAGCLAGARCVYSLWPGYLEVDSGQALRRWLAAHDIELLHHHSSGHATASDLARLAAAFAPARVVPIHSAAPERFATLFPRVEPHADGEWWEV